MSSNALESQGTVVRINSAAVPATFTAIPEIKDISFRTGSASVIDTTDLSSTAKEKRMGLADEGQMTLTLNWLPTNAVHAEIDLAKSDRQSRNFEIILTDGGAYTYTFSGFVLGVSLSAGVDGVLEASVTVEITGAVTGTP